MCCVSSSVIKRIKIPKVNNWMLKIFVSAGLSLMLRRLNKTSNRTLGNSKQELKFNLQRFFFLSHSRALGHSFLWIFLLKSHGLFVTFFLTKSKNVRSLLLVHHALIPPNSVSLLPKSNGDVVQFFWLDLVVLSFLHPVLLLLHCQLIKEIRICCRSNDSSKVQKSS